VFTVFHPTMDEARPETIDVEQLRPGMYIELELGWMAHPFPTSSFKISSNKQIEIIRGLGRQQIRFIPAKSDLPKTANAEPAATEGPADVQVAQARRDAEQQLRQQRAEKLAAQQRDLTVCERRFGQTVRQYKQALGQVHSRPREVMMQCQGMIGGFVTEILTTGESALRLLSDGMGDRLSMHPVNISILSMLLGKQLGLGELEMTDLGLAAFLHDLGKLELPDRVRWREDSISVHETKAYQTHVALGVMLGQRMGLPPGALQAIAQHHEMVDGSGFPGRLKGEAMTLPAKILALINRYEDLCNPSRPAAALTPHEALALLFAQSKSCFDTTVLSSFIRMMGVYPPGSVVQLIDERYAMVVSVNSARPLKPRVIVFDASVPKHEALILDLETAPELGIKRSLKPAGLPRAALDYLSPRQHICYFFERAVEAPLSKEVS
jgi:HD-GYP domain-containing protein (c-di-GMP phosphodiesterase class II)